MLAGKAGNFRPQSAKNAAAGGFAFPAFTGGARVSQEERSNLKKDEVGKKDSKNYDKPWLVNAQKAQENANN